MRLPRTMGCGRSKALSKSDSESDNDLYTKNDKKTNQKTNSKSKTTIDGSVGNASAMSFSAAAGDSQDTVSMQTMFSMNSLNHRAIHYNNGAGAGAGAGGGSANDVGQQPLEQQQRNSFSNLDSNAGRKTPSPQNQQDRKTAKSAFSNKLDPANGPVQLNLTATHSQIDFFRMLDRRIEEGPDYLSGEEDNT
ncbi:uncharacterized protein LOC141908302 [Tubulanus polymorphus]|uniref:uncharacterized protein LOC141908302 n=1 Tax=Tubulanus polymorphus TaxID=672921 RepID=UPI003DA29D19